MRLGLVAQGLGAGFREYERSFGFAQDDKGRFVLAMSRCDLGQTAMNGGATGWLGPLG
jgi:hypothetical protein